MTTSDQPTSVVNTKIPVMLLDLDGVINAFTKTIGIPGLPDTVRTIPKMLRQSWPEDTWRYGKWKIESIAYPLLWSTGVIRQLTAWHADGDVEMRWHTTWQHEALPVAQALFGLPEFKVQSAPEADQDLGVLAAELIRKDRPGWWKYPAVERVLTEERRAVIWVDDDITGRVSRTYRDKMAKMGSFLAVSPDGATGLTPRHLRLINIFIADHQEGQDDGRPPAGQVPGP